ncbi:MAG: tetratricopeptide repeat protein [Holophagaceae bacterium]
MDLNGAVGEGVRLWRAQRHLEALARFEAVLARAPRHYHARYHAGLALRDLARLREAEQAFLEAARLEPLRPEPLVALGNLRREQGRVRDALLQYRRALALDPRSTAALQNLALVLHCDEDAEGEDLRRAAEAWARVAAAAPGPRPRPRPRDPDPDRRLRVGFLSPDFRRHSCAFFLEPLFRHLDRARVEVLAYADVQARDDRTAAFEGWSDRFALVAGEDDDALEARIRAEAPDVLVDLAGHTGNNRLALFARRLAPVQATWLGCPGTTGLTAMDARLTDAIADPPGSSEAHHTEPLARLDPVFLCYQPPADAPEPAPAPSAGGAPFTFGSFNTLAKAGDRTVALWSTILRAAPGSRLLLKDKALPDPAHRAWVQSRFAAHGVDPARVLGVGWRAGDAEHLATYRHVDVALDPFPYNGTTTTCEALWMGVPVVTLEGRRHSGRVGASLLRAAGLGGLVAGGEEDYAALAVDLARDPARLAGLRVGLRERVAASPLCDGPGFARRFEAALRQLWRRAIEQAESKP